MLMAESYAAGGRRASPAGVTLSRGAGPPPAYTRRYPLRTHGSGHIVPLTNQGGDADMPRDIVDAVQGTLDFLILKSLSWHPMHGYGISRSIRENSDDEFRIEEGTLYPALHRLEDRGLIEAEWGLSENGRRAKYYSLTRAGRRELRDRVANWERYSRAMAKVLSVAPSVS